MPLYSLSLFDCSTSPTKSQILLLQTRAPLILPFSSMSQPPPHPPCTSIISYEDNLMNGVVEDLDLNQEPMDSSSNTGLGLGSVLNDSENTQSRIEQRIHHLQAVAARWRRQLRNSANTGNEARNSAHTGDEARNSANIGDETPNSANTGDEARNSGDEALNSANTGDEARNSGDEAWNSANTGDEARNSANTGDEARNSANTSDEARNSANTVNVGNEVQEDNCVGKGKGCKRYRSHLVAKALEMDSANTVKKVKKGGGSFFDCAICLDIAKEPILTCCGHLYCWACFYQLPYVDSTTKECPVCKGEVMDGNITPIYGNGNGDCSKEVECGLQLPPRPKAHRVDSVRQQRTTRGLSHIPVAEALRRIRINIRFGDSSNSPSGSQESRPLPSRVTRVLSESGASLSSELDNTQQMFEGLASSITDRIHERSNLQLSPVDHVGADEGNSLRRDAAADIIQSHQTLDAIAETGSSASVPSSSLSDEIFDEFLIGEPDN